eukprot:scaffold80403_cov22-Cyclotella_meneghiniana.AAC.2
MQRLADQHETKGCASSTEVRAPWHPKSSKSNPRLPKRKPPQQLVPYCDGQHQSPGSPGALSSYGLERWK